MNYYKELLQKAKQLNKVMIESNCKTQKDASYLEQGLNKIKDAVFDLVEFYRVNEYDLTDASKEFNLVEENWNKFAYVLQQKRKKPKLTAMDQQHLGMSLQKVLEQNKVLIRKLLQFEESSKNITNLTFTNYYKELLQKSKHLNKVMIESNCKTQKDASYLEQGLKNINDAVFDLVEFYRANEDELTDVSEKFDLFENSWDDFVHVLQEKKEKPRLTAMDQQKLGTSLQKVLEQNKVLTRKLLQHEESK